MNLSRFNFLCRTKTGFGKHALSHLPFDLAGMGSQKPFVLQSRDAERSGSTQPLIRAFRESGMTLGICPAPDRKSDNKSGKHPDGGFDMEMLKACYQTFIEKGFDSIIALGGSSLADAAKALNMAVSFGPGILKEPAIGPPASEPLMPFAYLPTGAGTGWETDCTARFNGRFFDRADLAPDIALIDPAVFAEQDLAHAIDSGLTGLAVCCETFVLSGNPPAAAYAEAGIRLIRSSLFALLDRSGYPDTPTVLPHKEVEPHLAGLAHASVITGILLANCRPLTCLDLGRAVADRYSLFQGQAMMMILPQVLKVLSSDPRELGALLLPLSGQDEFSATPAHQRSDAALHHLRAVLNTLYRLSSGTTLRTPGDMGMDSIELDHPATHMDEKSIGDNHRSGPGPDQIKAILLRTVGNPAVNRE